MKDIVREYQELFRRQRQNLRRYTALLLALALITTLFVNWQLHSDGIAITADYQCGQEEHEHTADCYTKVLVCGYEEGEPEDWNATMPDDSMNIDDSFGVDTSDSDIAAYSAEPEYIFVPHEHTDECYQEVRELNCFQEEHEHTDDCFDPEDGSLICDLFEHTHDDSCYSISYELVCGLEEGELVEELNPDYVPVQFEEPVAAKPVVVSPVIEAPIHYHTDACYEEVLTCGLEEHHHTVNCLADPLADLEDESEWLTKTNTTLTGLWSADLLTVAQSQLGYEQSEKNFELDADDGVTVRHYTRYGEWYGNPYGEWDVMFLSYCLNYAGVPRSAIPQRAGVLALRSDLRSSGYLVDPSDGMSISDILPGDIVLYNTTSTETVAVEEEPQIEDLSADADTELLATLSVPVSSEPQTEERTVTYETVGIVSSVDEASGTVTVISGNVDGKVAEVTLTFSELTGVIPVNSVQAMEDSGDTTLEDVQGLDGKDYVTKFEIKKETSSGRYENADTVLTTDKVMGRLELDKIPAKKIKENGYKVYVDIPAGIDCSNISGKLNDGDGTYTFVQDGDHWVLVLTYDEDFIHQQELSDESEVSSWVQFNFQWDTEEISKNGENDFEINDSAKVTITINEDKKDDTKSDKFSLSKTSSDLRFDGTDAYIDYTVTLTLNEDVKAPFTLTDTLTNLGNASFVYTDETPTITNDAGGTVPSIAWNGTGDTTRDIVLGTEGDTITNGTYKITYHVKCSDFSTSKLEKDAKVKNKVNATYEDEDHSSRTDTSLSNTPISKSGKLTKDGYIEWTVKLNTPNSDGALAYLKNASFTDKLPDDLLNGEITVKKDGGSKQTVTLTPEQYDPDTKTINYPLEDGYHYYEITYRTKAPENTGLTDTTVTNTGTIEDDNIDSSATGSVDITSDILHKKLAEGTHTSDTASMSWTTTIDAEDLSSFVYYDWSNTIYANGAHIKLQNIVSGSVVVKLKDGTDVTNKVKVDYHYSRTENGVDVGLFSVDFKDSGVTGPVTISYQTTTDLTKLPAGSRVVITNYGQLNNGKTVSDKYDFVNSNEEQIKYFYKYGGSFDYSNVVSGEGTIKLKPGEALPWTIILNDNDADKGGLPNKVYNEWVVRDVIPEGLILDESSISITSYGNYTAVAGVDYTYTVEPQVVDGQNCTVITITLKKSCIMNGDKPRTHVVVTYNTYLDPNNSALSSEDAIKFTNHASFTCDGEQKGDTKFTETVTRDIVGKQGTFDDSTGTLTYYVKVNPYGVKLLEQDDGELLLYDQMDLPDQLCGVKETKTKYVWLESVSVYKGEFVNDEFVPTTWIKDLTAVSIKHDDSEFNNAATAPVTTDSYYAKDDANFTQIKAWTKVPDATPLVLVFHYTVDMRSISLAAGTQLDFTNKVKLNNNDKWSITDKSLSHIYDSTGGADIRYNSDRLTIHKYSGNMNSPLSGAKFTLERYDEGTGWTMVNSNISTNNSGNYVLTVSRDVLYRIRETEPPAGYLLPENNDYVYFYVSRNTGYTPPDKSNATNVRLYQVTTSEDNVYQNFYYNVENAKNPDYITPGNLKVAKLWKDSAGNTITDESMLEAMPSVQVTLTKHSKQATVIFRGTDSSTVHYHIYRGSKIIFTDWVVSRDDKFFTLSQDSSGTAKIEKGISEVNGIPTLTITDVTGDIIIDVNSSGIDSWISNAIAEIPGDSNGGDFTSTVGSVTLSNTKGWSYTWFDLEVSDDVYYTIEEVTSDENYQTSYKVDGKDVAAGYEIRLNAAEGTNVQIINQSTQDGYELPSTGGAGTTLYTAVGGAMALTALVCGFCQKRRRERRAH